jgi:hypothetical protein
MKKWVGKREAKNLMTELAAIDNKLENLSEEVDGFQKFYDDIDASRKLVNRKQWIEEVIQKGFYYKLRDV